MYTINGYLLIHIYDSYIFSKYRVGNVSLSFDFSYNNHRESGDLTEIFYNIPTTYK